MIKTPAGFYGDAIYTIGTTFGGLTVSLSIRIPWFSFVLSYLLVFQLLCGSGMAQDPPAPTQLNIVIVEGEGALNSVRQRVAREPVVQVEDENHKPIAGVAITFLLPNQGAGAAFANGAKSLTVLTDDKGQAIARGLKPNNINGQYQIRVNASYRGKTASTTITQTNAITAAAVAGGISAKLLVILAIAGGAAAAGAVAATRGGGGNNTPAAPSPTVITPGTPTVGAPR
jgi:hypothetical protein